MEHQDTFSNENLNVLRLIFLDIDGVLNSERFAVWCATSSSGKDFLHKGGHHWVDPECVKLIENLCKNTNTRIVISSSWRYGDILSTISNLERYRDIKPLIKYIVGITPSVKSRIRGEEISWFLKHKNYPPIEPYTNFYDFNYFIGTKRKQINYCIIDDDTDMLDDQLNNFVKINNYTGVTNKDIEKITNILNGNNINNI